MNIKPLGDRIVIRRFEADEKTTGGILLPDSAKNKPQKGKVLAVGPGKLNKEGKRTRWPSRKATWCCSPTGPATNSRGATATTSCSCAKKTCWRCWNSRRVPAVECSARAGVSLNRSRRSRLVELIE